MARKGVFPIVATLAVVGVVLAVFSQTGFRFFPDQHGKEVQRPAQ